MPNDTIWSLISSLLPIVITLLFAWLSSRNDQARRKQIVEDAKQRIELISEYVASQNLVLDDPNELGVIKKIAASELYDIKAFLDNKLQSLEKSSEKSEGFFQRFFLLYKMRTGAASFLRICFFMVLLASIFWSILMSSIGFSPEQLQENGWGLSIAVLIMLTTPAVLVALLLRWLAIKFDKPADSTEKQN